MNKKLYIIMLLQDANKGLLEEMPAIMRDNYQDGDFSEVVDAIGTLKDKNNEIKMQILKMMSWFDFGRKDQVAFSRMFRKTYDQIAVNDFTKENFDKKLKDLVAYVLNTKDEHLKAYVLNNSLNRIRNVENYDQEKGSNFWKALEDIPSLFNGKKKSDDIKDIVDTFEQNRDHLEVSPKRVNVETLSKVLMRNGNLTQEQIAQLEAWKEKATMTDEQLEERIHYLKGVLYNYVVKTAALVLENTKNDTIEGMKEYLENYFKNNEFYVETVNDLAAYEEKDRNKVFFYPKYKKEKQTILERVLHDLTDNVSMLYKEPETFKKVVDFCLMLESFIKENRMKLTQLEERERNVLEYFERLYYAYGVIILTTYSLSYGRPLTKFNTYAAYYVIKKLKQVDFDSNDRYQIHALPLRKQKRNFFEFIEKIGEIFDVEYRTDQMDDLAKEFNNEERLEYVEEYRLDLKEMYERILNRADQKTNITFKMTIFEYYKEK